MSYVNRVWLQGQISTPPTTKALTPRTKLTSFYLSVVESWINDQDQPRERKNQPLIEVVGREAERVARDGRVGSWATIEGYLRTEEVKGGHVTKIRTLSITIWEKGGP